MKKPTKAPPQPAHSSNEAVTLLQTTQVAVDKIRKKLPDLEMQFEVDGEVDIDLNKA